MMINKPIYMTAKGKIELEAELEQLHQVVRPECLERLHDVQSGGDWGDNTEAWMIQEEMGLIDGRIHELEEMLADIVPIEVGHAGGVATIGSTTLIQADGNVTEKYTIVGAAEADPAQGYISNESPVGRALLNHRAGDEVSVKAPDGVIHFRIVAVS